MEVPRREVAGKGCCLLGFSELVFRLKMQTQILSHRNPEVKNQVLNQVRLFPAFANWDTASLGELLEGAEVQNRPPHYVVWESDSDLALSILSDGLIAVDYDKRDEESIDSFILKGQLLGDFEYLEIKSHKTRLTTLTDSTIITLRPESIEEIGKRAPELLYRTVAASLGSKLDHKSGIVNLLRKKEVIDRLKFLLLNFRPNTRWSFLFKDLNKDKNSFEFNFLWSDGNLRSLLSTDFRSVKERLTALVKDKVLSLTLYELLEKEDKKGIFKTKTLTVEYLEKDCEQRKHTYIKIHVLDQERLRKYKYVSQRLKKAKS